MAEVTVKQLAKAVNTPVEKLLEQFSAAGLEFNAPDQPVSDEEKVRLLNHLRSHRSKDLSCSSSEDRKITLRRKSTSQLKIGGAAQRGSSAATATVSVEVRRKRTYIKRRFFSEKESKVEQQGTEKETAREQPKQPKQQVKDKGKDKDKGKEKVLQNGDAVAAKPEESKDQEDIEQPVPSPVPSPVTEAKVEEKDKAPAEPTPIPADADNKAKRQELRVASGKRGKRKIKTKKRRPGKVTSSDKHRFEKPTAPVKREVFVPENISISDLAQKMAVKAAEVIAVMMEMGVMVTINQVIDQDTAMLVVEEMGHAAEPVHEANIEADVLQIESGTSFTDMRSPVVTVMGHVDHGKTSLLDYLRRTKVASSEAGGITQHMGAYSVDTDKGTITFLDTPGHAAFTAMRTRGAQVTDIVVLVVAADDGVMLQTKEAIQHSRAANVPIIVAVNKIDKENSDPERVRNDLAAHDVIPEEWGGENIFVNISAITGAGVDDLLEAISLQAEILELKAVNQGPAKGVIIESSLDKGRGPIATVLVQQGKLSRGDMLLTGEEFGRVRAMFDEYRKEIYSAGPSTPVEVLGLSGVANAGDEIVVVSDERRVREIVDLRRSKSRDTKFAEEQTTKLGDIFSQLDEGVIASINVLVKADVQGSMEALRDSLKKLSTEEVKVTIVMASVGGVNESDIHLAEASEAIVIGFNVRTDNVAKRTAADLGIEIRYYSVIYEVIDDIKLAMNGLLTPELREEITGFAKVKEVFRSSKMGAVAGTQVIEGIVKRGNPIRVLRDNIVIYEGELESLRRHKDDVDEVRAGTECGIAVKNYDDVKVGDHIEVYTRTEIVRSL